MEKLMEQELVALDNVQIKIEQKIAIPVGAKKVMGVSCHLFGQKTEVNQNEITLSGNLVTRCVFMNEFDKYDSEDISEPFEKKVTVKDYESFNKIIANVRLANCRWHLADDKIVLDNIVAVNIKGVKVYERQIVGNLTGKVEVRKTEYQRLTFNTAMREPFEITENIQLDNACEGVLGVDVNPNLKSILANQGKINLKGCFVANILGVKTVDSNSIPYNATHEIEFSKSFSVNGITEEDLAVGEVIVDSVKMHIENTNQGAVLVLNLAVIFDGSVYCKQKFSCVSDAICFDKELTLQTKRLSCVELLSQVNSVVDIENNINLAPNTPYIAHVLAVDNISINDLQANVGDNKALIEGVLSINLLLENEEHLVTGEHFDVPFQTHVRVDNLDREYVLTATVVPLRINVKARRGTELLVDAQLGVCLQSETKKEIAVVDSLIEGQIKEEDDSAIRIYIIGEKEGLWDLAKRTNLSCESLLQQNPNLENGCTPGERIVVYRHENVNL